MYEPDDELEAELRRLAADREPVPAELVQAAVDAFGWRDIDAELAELVYDSLVDADEASLVRGPPGQRLVSFAVGGLTIDVEVTSAGAGRTVMGQIAPPQRASVDIRYPRKRSRLRRTSWDGSGQGRCLRARRACGCGRRPAAPARIS